MFVNRLCGIFHDEGAKKCIVLRSNDVALLGALKHQLHGSNYRPTRANAIVGRRTARIVGPPTLYIANRPQGSRLAATSVAVYADRDQRNIVVQVRTRAAGRPA